MSPNTPHTPHDFANQEKTTAAPGLNTIIIDKLVGIQHLDTGGTGSVLEEKSIRESGNGAEP